MNELTDEQYSSQDRVCAYGKILRFTDKGEDQIANCCDHTYAKYLETLWNDRINEPETTSTNT